MFSSVRQGVFFHSSRGIDGVVKESFFAQLPQRGFRSIAAGLFAQAPQGLELSCLSEAGRIIILCYFQ